MRIKLYIKDYDFQHGVEKEFRDSQVKRAE